MKIRSSKNQFIINMTSQIFVFIFNIAVGFWLGPYVIKHIGKEVYGFAGLAENFTSYISVFTVAINGMLARYVTIEVSKNNYASANKYFSSVTLCNIVISAVLSIAMIFFCLRLENIINIPDAHINDIKLLFLFTFLSFFLSLAGSSFAISTFVTNRLEIRSLRALESKILNLAIIIIMFSTLLAKIWYIGFASLLTTIFLIIVNLYYTRKLTPEIKLRRKYFDWAVMRELVGVGIWNSINQLSQILLTGLDLLITNLFINAQSMSLLSLAKMIPLRITMFNAMISNVFVPKMTILYGKDDKEGFLREVKFAMRTCGFLTSVPIVGFIVFGKSFFSLWVSSLPGTDINTVQILSILTLLPAVVSTFIFPLYSVNTITCKLRTPVLVTLTLSIINTIIVLILINTTSLGVYAVAGVSSILLLFRIIIFVPLYAAHNLKVKWNTFYPPLIRGVISMLLLFIIFSVVNRFTSINSWGQLIIIASVSGIVGYIINLFVLFNNREKNILKQMVMQKFRKRGDSV